MNFLLKKSYIWFLLSILQFSTPLAAAEKQPVMGAGPSTKVVTIFFQNFSKLSVTKDYEFEVEPRSIKHAGGIRSSSKYLFGRTGRPLNAREKLQNKKELFIARIPLAFVVGNKAGVKEINIKQLEAIFTRKITNWRELGGSNHSIVLAGREQAEAAFNVIKNDYPFFHQVKFDREFKRDHQVVNFITSHKGDYAISFGAKSNFTTENLLRVNGFNSGVSLGLVYDQKNARHPVVKAAIDYANSADWRAVLKETDFLPPM